MKIWLSGFIELITCFEFGKSSFGCNDVYFEAYLYEYGCAGEACPLCNNRLGLELSTSLMHKLTFPLTTVLCNSEMTLTPVSPVDALEQYFFYKTRNKLCGCIRGVEKTTVNGAL